MLIDVLRFFLTPSNVITTLLVLGAGLFLHPRSRNIGCRLAGAGIVLYIVFGCGPLSYFILGQLEHRYPPLHQLTTDQPVSAIVVLAAYGVSDAYFPPSSRVNEASLYRTVEAARHWHQAKKTVILLAGPQVSTIAMADMLKALHVPDHIVQRLPASQNTLGNILSLKPFLKNKPFLLVTSAGHMPRSVLICKEAGLKPIPAPTDFKTHHRSMNATWFPTPFYLKCSDLAVHEFFAILYLKHKGISGVNR